MESPQLPVPHLASSWPPGLLSDSSSTAKAQVGRVAAHQPPEADADFMNAKPVCVTLMNQPGFVSSDWLLAHKHIRFSSCHFADQRVSLTFSCLSLRATARRAALTFLGF